MPSPDPLADLRARFIERSRERVASLRQLIDTAVEDRVGGFPSADTHEADATPAEAITRLAHQLAGAAGTFGYPAMSRAAAALEDRVRAAGETARPLDPGSLEPLVAALERRVTELGAAAC